MSERQHFDRSAELLREVVAGRQVSLTILLDKDGHPLWMSPAAESLWRSGESDRLRTTIRLISAEIVTIGERQTRWFRAELGGIPCLVKVSRWGAEANSLLARLTVDVPERMVVKHQLTDAEVKVAEHVARGSRNENIAKVLGISLHTVHTHVSRILRKLNAESRVKVAACWMEARFFEEA